MCYVYVLWTTSPPTAKSDKTPRTSYMSSNLVHSMTFRHSNVAVVWSPRGQCHSVRDGWARVALSECLSSCVVRHCDARTITTFPSAGHRRPSCPRSFQCAAGRPWNRLLRFDTRTWRTDSSQRQLKSHLFCRDCNAVRLLYSAAEQARDKMRSGADLRADLNGDNSVVKVRGRGLSPALLKFEHPAIVWAPLVESIKCYFMPK